MTDFIIFERCPFCQNEQPVITEKFDLVSTGHSFAFVQCQCGARGPIMHDGALQDARTRALIAWNKAPRPAKEP